MKLIQYTSRNLITPLLLILAVWAGCFYFLILHEVDDETNDSLENYKEIIIKTVLADSTLLHDHVDIMTRYYIREVPEEEANLDKDIFYDSTIYIEAELEDEPVRVLQTWFRASDGKYYELTIKTSTLEKEDMARTILWSIVALYILLLCCILIVTQIAFHKSFQPLYSIVKWLKNYHPDKTHDLPDTTNIRIEEVEVLHTAIGEYAHRSAELYNLQKQFVENSAHELQTPLAICLNKLELLGENPDCTEEMLIEIADLHQTLSNLSRTNKALLLLSRIENKQFPETTSVNINTTLSRILPDFEQMYEHKNITVEIKETSTLSYTMNESLATTLISNLIKNAFIHNKTDGCIKIAITHRSFSIANSSDTPELDAQSIFKRFKSQSKRAGSTGLGLAIAKSISDIYAIKITYNYNKGFHRFILTFP